jgi:hypothetical protein
VEQSTIHNTTTISKESTNRSTKIKPPTLKLPNLESKKYEKINLV